MLVRYNLSSNIDHISMDGDYLVAPVVMLVEGVVQASNSDVPELVLASDFSKNAYAWNGRPVTLGHPKSSSGEPTSANLPNVSTVGRIYNTRTDGKKLKSDIYISVTETDVIQRLQQGETLEVSTGLYANVTETSGIYNNDVYFGVWTDIIPDHLAVLPPGLEGACSVEMGCGTPRLNESDLLNLESCLCEEHMERTSQTSTTAADTHAVRALAAVAAVASRVLQSVKHKENVHVPATK